MENILTTVLSSTLFVSTAFAAPMPSNPHVAFTRVLPQEGYVGYVVDKNSTLANIAEHAYGTEEHWTTLWNDNAWITDPEGVVQDAVLKIRLQKPQEPVALAPELTDRNNDAIKQQNDDYLKQIGFLTAEAVQPAAPTAVPTAIPTQQPVAASNPPSSISEEAITYLGNCEAGNDPAKNTGNGYYGAFQFSYGTWQRLNTGYERADLAPIDVQRAAVKQLLAKSSIYGQFPACAKKMRNAGLI